MHHIWSSVVMKNVLPFLKLEWRKSGYNALRWIAMSSIQECGGYQNSRLSCPQLYSVPLIIKLFSERCSLMTWSISALYEYEFLLCYTNIISNLILWHLESLLFFFSRIRVDLRIDFDNCLVPPRTWWTRIVATTGIKLWLQPLASFKTQQLIRSQSCWGSTIII